ncbi:MAG TPA: hypothetical protein VER03_00245 [Bryobacteraceae bacterium]|nr:hypothetical protein [Bryobacteraceae bacterium]
MTRRFCLMLLSRAAAAQIMKPRIGYIVDRENNLRAIEGVAGAFTVSSPLQRGVLSAAFSGRSLVIKTGKELRIDTRCFDALEGPAVVVFDSKGEAAEIFFPSAQVLWTWHNGEFLAARALDVVADVYVRDGELLVRGVPVRLPRRVMHVAHLGEGWLAAYAEDCVYAVRGEQVFELPEGGAE